MGRARISALKLKISFNTVSSAVRRLFNAGILFHENESSRNRIFYHKDYLYILRQGTE